MCLFGIFSVYNKLRDHKWNKYSEDRRLEVLEKIEKKQAKKLKIEPLEIAIYNDENWRCYGMFEVKRGEKTLWINPRLLSDQNLRFHALETIFHETRHAYQHHVITKKRLHFWQTTARKWKKNYSGYFSSAEDDVIYGMQPIERDAQKYALKQMAKLERKYDDQDEYHITMRQMIYRYNETEMQAKREHGMFYNYKISKKIKDKNKIN